jgi:hypothetical protein
MCCSQALSIVHYLLASNCWGMAWLWKQTSTPATAAASVLAAAVQLEMTAVTLLAVNTSWHVTLLEQACMQVQIFNYFCAAVAHTLLKQVLGRARCLCTATAQQGGSLAGGGSAHHRRSNISAGAY